jgi:hypothetical protein
MWRVRVLCPFSDIVKKLIPDKAGWRLSLA